MGIKFSNILIKLELMFNIISDPQILLIAYYFCTPLNTDGDIDFCLNQKSISPSYLCTPLSYLKYSFIQHCKW